MRRHRPNAAFACRPREANRLDLGLTSPGLVETPSFTFGLALAVAGRRTRSVAAPSLPCRIDRLKHLEGAHKVLIDRHHRTAVVELAAVVRRRKDGDERAITEKLVTVLHDLMSSHDEVEVIALQKF